MPQVPENNVRSQAGAWPERVLAILTRHGVRHVVRHVVHVPDAGHAATIRADNKAARVQPPRNGVHIANRMRAALGHGVP